MARRIGDLPRGAEATLAVLREAGIDPGSVDWERSLAINYAVLVGHGARMIDVGGKKGRHARIFCDKLAAQRIVIFEPNPRMIEILRERFTSMNVSIVPKAVGETPGRFEFLVNRENPVRDFALVGRTRDDRGSSGPRLRSSAWTTVLSLATSITSRLTSKARTSTSSAALGRYLRDHVP
jgi:FkbM family methyltransferase